MWYFVNGFFDLQRGSGPIHDLATSEISDPGSLLLSFALVFTDGIKIIVSPERRASSAAETLAWLTIKQSVKRRLCLCCSISTKGLIVLALTLPESFIYFLREGAVFEGEETVASGKGCSEEKKKGLAKALKYKMWEVTERMRWFYWYLCTDCHAGLCEIIC